MTDACMEVVERVLSGSGYSIPRTELGMFESEQFILDATNVRERKLDRPDGWDELFESSVGGKGIESDMLTDKYKQALRGDPEFIEAPVTKLSFDPNIQDKAGLESVQLLEALQQETLRIKRAFCDQGCRAHAYELKETTTGEKETDKLRTIG